MEKEQLLKEMKNKINSRELSRDQVLKLFEKERHEQSSVSTLKEKFTLFNILYGVGGLIVLLGVVVLLGQQWEAFSSVVRVMVTLGGGLVFYVMGVLFSRYYSLDVISQVFFVLSAVLIPCGLFVWLFESGRAIGSFGVQSVVAVILFVLFGASFLLFRRTVFILATTVFGTWLFYSFVSFLSDAGSLTFLSPFRFYSSLTMVAGASYLACGWSISQSRWRGVTLFFYALGSSAVLGAGVAQGGLWDVIYPLLVFGVMYLSVYVKSKAVLAISAFFLMIYIVNITGEYFARSLGWPISLVAGGFVLIGVGYVAFYMNQNYIDRSQV